VIGRVIQTILMKNPFRSLAWRIGRSLYCWARGDVLNSPESNGEHWLLKKAIDAVSARATMLDVGANVGDWTSQAVAYSAQEAKSVKVISFEPCSATRETLQKRLSAVACVEICDYALSSREGQAEFFSAGAGRGTNSLSAVSGAISETVRLTTMDSLLLAKGIDRVHMVKIDTEGFDLDVMRGAAQSLSAGKIDLIQFEYNWRWLLNGASLREVFNFVADKPYRVGKLVGSKIVFYPHWHFELDKFFENNYVLVRLGSEFEALGVLARFDSHNVAVASD